MSEYKGIVDIPSIMPHQDKYPTVYKTFDSLRVGEKMELINDHDFIPIFTYKFPEDFPNQYEWKYLEQGPEVWRAEIIKISEKL